MARKADIDVVRNIINAMDEAVKAKVDRLSSSVDEVRVRVTAMATSQLAAAKAHADEADAGTPAGTLKLIEQMARRIGQLESKIDQHERNQGMMVDSARAAMREEIRKEMERHCVACAEIKRVGTWKRVVDSGTSHLGAFAAGPEVVKALPVGSPVPAHDEVPTTPAVSDKNVPTAKQAAAGGFGAVAAVEDAQREATAAALRSYLGVRDEDSAFRDTDEKLLRLAQWARAREDSNRGLLRRLIEVLGLGDELLTAVDGADRVSDPVATTSVGGVSAAIRSDSESPEKRAQRLSDPASSATDGEGKVAAGNARQKVAQLRRAKTGSIDGGAATEKISREVAEVKERQKKMVATADRALQLAVAHDDKLQELANLGVELTAAKDKLAAQLQQVEKNHSGASSAEVADMSRTLHEELAKSERAVKRAEAASLEAAAKLQSVDSTIVAMKDTVIDEVTRRLTPDVEADSDIGRLQMWAMGAFAPRVLVNRHDLLEKELRRLLAQLEDAKSTLMSETRRVTGQFTDLASTNGMLRGELERTQWQVREIAVALNVADSLGTAGSRRSHMPDPELDPRWMRDDGMSTASTASLQRFAQRGRRTDKAGSRPNTAGSARHKPRLKLPRSASARVSSAAARRGRPRSAFAASAEHDTKAPSPLSRVPREKKEAAVRVRSVARERERSRSSERDDGCTSPWFDPSAPSPGSDRTCPHASAVPTCAALTHAAVGQGRALRRPERDSKQCR